MFRENEYGELVLACGKYKGRRLKDVAKNDSYYLHTRYADMCDRMSEIALINFALGRTREGDRLPVLAGEALAREMDAAVPRGS